MTDFCITKHGYFSYVCFQDEEMTGGKTYIIQLDHWHKWFAPTFSYNAPTIIQEQ